MSKQKRKEKLPELTISGFNYDKDLAKVPIKVFPALQALIANQIDLIEIVEKYDQSNFIFIEAHKSEMAEIENTISKAYSLYIEKKEKVKAKRAEKKKNSLLEKEQPGEKFRKNMEFGDYELAIETDNPENESLPLDELAKEISPGLPSSKYESRKPSPQQEDNIDLRRIAIGAAIQALSGLLDRALTEEEINSIEKEVDSYL